MGLKLITPASTYPVTLAEAKLHCRVDAADDDALITALITAATEMAEQELGRAIMPQTWELTLDAFPDAFALTRTPVQSITSVKYIDVSGNQQALASNLYVLDVSSADGFAYVVPAVGTSWPETRDQINAVSVQYQAYFSAVPESIKQWIKLMISAMYANRETEVIPVRAATATVRMQFVDRLLDRYRMAVL